MPKLRFPGFEGEWENTELGNLAIYGKDKTRVTKNHFVSTENIEQNFGGIVPFEDSKTMVDGTEFTKGDILIANIRPYLKKIWQSDMDGACNADVLVLKPQEIDNVFFYFLVAQNKFIDYVMGGVKGSKMPRGDKAHILQYNTAVPSILEQQQIAKFLSLLSNRIATQKELVETLKKYKRGLLSAIFPEKDKATPIYRLSEFTEPWEQRKAVDIAEYSKGNGYSKSDLTESGTPIILYGRLYTKYQFVINEVDTFAIPKASAVYSQGNEVIIPASGETAEDIARASAVEKPGVLLGGDLNILRPFDFINPSFLALAISSGEPQKELEKRAQGKSVVHIHNSDIQEIIISYPARIEQDQIVAIFRRLDHLITLHQRELELFTKYKLGLLQQLFI